MTHSLLQLLWDGELPVPASHRAAARDGAKQLQWIPRCTMPELTSQQLQPRFSFCLQDPLNEPVLSSTLLWFFPKGHLNMTPVPLHLNHEPFSFFVGTLTISFSYPGTNSPIRKSFLDWWPLKGSEWLWAGHFLGSCGLLEVNARIFQFPKIQLGFTNGLTFQSIEIAETNASKRDFNQNLDRLTQQI